MPSLAGQPWGPTTRGARHHPPHPPPKPGAPGSPPRWSSLSPVAAHPSVVRLPRSTAAGTAQRGTEGTRTSAPPPSSELAGAGLPREADSAGNCPGPPFTGRSLGSPFPSNRLTHRGRERRPTPGARIPALPARPAGGFGGALGYQGLPVTSDATAS